MSGIARCAAAALAAALLAPPAATAQTAPVEVPGFAVRPPAPFVATPSGHPEHDVSFVISSSTGEPKGFDPGGRICQLGFKLSDRNEGLTQREINALVDRGPWRQTSRTTLGSLFNILGEEVVTLGAARGVEYVATPRTMPASVPMRMVLTIVETPKGRMSSSCAVRTEELERSRPLFKALRDGVTLPQ